MGAPAWTRRRCATCWVLHGCRECSDSHSELSTVGGLPGRPARLTVFLHLEPFLPGPTSAQYRQLTKFPRHATHPVALLAGHHCQQDTRPVTICTNNCCSGLTGATRAWSEQTCRGSGCPRDCFLKFKSCPCSTQYPPVQSPHLPATADPWQ